MECGIFDHLDQRREPVSRTYAERIELIQAAEQAGFRAYHLAEHHGTPLGLAPSPSVFLSAVAAGTRRIRMGAMVYCLPLYSPLRLLEEICMLDHLSGGRLDVGVGKGASPFETGFHGIDPDQAVERYVETLDVLLQGLRQPLLNHRGRFFRYDNVPVILQPLQERIPLWSAAAAPEAQEHAARLGMHLMVSGAVERVKQFADNYRRVWPANRPPGTAAVPMIGAYRLVHVARTDAEAEARARPAFEFWFKHLAKLWRENNATTPILSLKDFDTAQSAGMMLCGSPQRVLEKLSAQRMECGFNYAVLQFAFGSLGHAAELESLEMFAERVMPGFD